MQIEHVPNVEKHWTWNSNKLLKKWHEKPKERKTIQKCTEDTASGGITTREYNDKYTLLLV